MQELESIERLLTKSVATSKPGQGLPLIGGFRLRLLNDSPRISADVDYHWEGDLEEKRTEIASFLEKEFLPRVADEFGYVGRAVPVTGADDSPFVKVVTVILHRPEGGQGRLEIPVDITRIQRMDEMEVRTKDGTVYLTLSDRDMIEGKVIAICNRTFLEIRDVVDLFLFQDHLAADSGERICAKIEKMPMNHSGAVAVVNEFAGSRARYVAAINEVLASQLDPNAADRIREGGGAGMVFDRVEQILRRTVCGAVEEKE